MSQPPLRVLLVNDDPWILDGLSRALRTRRVTTRVATNAEQALAILEVEPFDGIITDLDLGPGSSGLSLLATVRERHPALRRLIHSGSEPLLVNAGLAHHIFAKPADLDALVAALVAGAAGEPLPARRESTGF